MVSYILKKNIGVNGPKLSSEYISRKTQLTSGMELTGKRRLFS